MKKIKKAATVVSYTTAIILVMLVVAIVLLTIFKADILDFFRNLPGSRNPANNSDVIVNANEPEFDSICPVRVARISGKTIYFCNEQDKPCMNFENLIPSSLYWEGEEDKAEIYVLLTGWFGWDRLKGDVAIGTVGNTKITILPEIFKGIGVYGDVLGVIPNYYFLSKLDGSKRLPGNWICRETNVQISAEKQSLTFDNPIEMTFDRLVRDFRVKFRYSPYSLTSGKWEYNWGFGWWDVNEFRSDSTETELKSFANSLSSKNEELGIALFKEIKTMGEDKNKEKIIIRNLPNIEMQVPDNSEQIGSIQNIVTERKIFLMIEGVVDTGLIINSDDKIMAGKLEIGTLDPDKKTINIHNFALDPTASYLKDFNIPLARVKRLHQAQIINGKIYEIK